MPTPKTAPRELQILEQIETDPDVTQATLAEQMGVAVGTVNFTVKRLVSKGYVRVTQLERRRLKYIITPEGIALRTKLAMVSLKYSMRLYRETREQAKKLIAKAARQGYRQIAIRGNGELEDVVRLTCLELNMTIGPEAGKRPVLAIVGTTLTLELPD
jgi:DNA-binding MarR family transcriptional regulator